MPFFISEFNLIKVYASWQVEHEGKGCRIWLEN